MKYRYEVIEIRNNYIINNTGYKYVMYTQEAELNIAIKIKSDVQKKFHYPPPYLKFKNFISYTTKPNQLMGKIENFPIIIPPIQCL